MTLIARTPIRDQVYDHLIGRILSGDLPPGVSIQDTVLAERLGVSRTPVREALLRLSQEGFLDSTPGRGFAVRPMDAGEIREAYPILWTLEGLAVSLTGPLPESVLARLRRLNGQLERESEDSLRRLKLDATWHETLVSNCHNRRLLDTIAQLRNVVRRYELAYMGTAGRVGDSARDHAGVIALLERGEHDRVGQVLETHWRKSLDALVSALEA